LCRNQTCADDTECLEIVAKIIKENFEENYIRVIEGDRKLRLSSSMRLLIISFSPAA